MKIEAKARLSANARVTAAPIRRERRIAFIKELLSRLKPKFPVLYLDSGGESISGDPFSAQEFEKLKQELKKLGWVTPFKVKGIQGLMRKDKTWPVGCNLRAGEVVIDLGYDDTMDKSVQKEDANSYKAVVESVCKALGAKITRTPRVQGSDEYTVFVTSDLDRAAATKAMTKGGYGKPRVSHDLLVFKKDHGDIELGFNKSGTLDNVSCGA